MMNLSIRRHGLLLGHVLLVLICWICNPPKVSATDYFLTIGGGYEPEGNQASLEANVVFFQRLLATKHPSPSHLNVYFADGNDPAADLQIVADTPAVSKTPATDLLASLHRRRGEEYVAYRNHQIPQVSGPLDPALIKSYLENIARLARSGDRLIVYVTAHGSEGPERDAFNTTIDCWNDKEITAREFSDWLNKLPPQVPVVMVMAQCYCGGFGHTIFQGLDKDKGLQPQLRAGFFAQQYDLPAAGCRPDIEHDEEFSSYFWGAIAGRSRNGVPIHNCDIDGNGSISFAEAYAYAVTAGETIDIPLRTSEVLLRAYSRLSPPKPKEDAADSDSKTENGNPVADPAEQPATPPVYATMNGTLQSFITRGRPASGRIVTRLANTLGFTLDDDVQKVLAAREDHRRAGRFQGRGGRRQGSARRDLLREVAEKWPELGDERHWNESQLLKADNQEKLVAELKQLPGWKGYEDRLKQRAEDAKKAELHELRAVKFRRLINALESIVLEQNLPLSASPEVMTRFQQIMALEESTLDPAELRK